MNHSQHLTWILTELLSDSQSLETLVQEVLAGQSSKAVIRIQYAPLGKTINVIGDPKNCWKHGQMSESDCLYLAVEDHPSGRHTLTKKDKTMSMQQDFEGELHTNPNTQCFFTSIGRKTRQLVSEGVHNIVLKF